MKRRFRFIINPISGGKDKTSIPERIRNIIQNENIDAEIIVSKNSEDTIYQAKDAVVKNFDAVIAVGGDGTCTVLGGGKCTTTGIGGTLTSLGGIYRFDKNIGLFALYAQNRNGSNAIIASSAVGGNVTNLALGVLVKF